MPIADHPSALLLLLIFVAGLWAGVQNGRAAGRS
jgi:hypothetical protein